jgi:hypothetical protein
MFSEHLSYCTHGTILSVVMLVSRGCVAHVFKQYNFPKHAWDWCLVELPLPFKKNPTVVLVSNLMSLLEKKHWMSHF